MKKAGGRVYSERLKEKYGNRNFKEVIRELMCQFMETNERGDAAV